MSILEGKDRSELAAIAEQLGQKPSARMKKSDIAELIKELVGAAPASQGTTDKSDEKASQAQAGSGDDDKSAASESSGASPEVPSTQAKPVSSKSEARSSQPDADKVGPGDNASESPSEGNGATAESGGDSAEESGGESPADGDGVEPGNRRRRRRGRERGREENEPLPEPVEVQGMVELRDEGYGFLRLEGYLPSRDDAYVSMRQTRQFGLRTGDIVRGKSRGANRNERNPALLQVDEVNGFQAHNQPERVRFADLTPVIPTEPLNLELADNPSNSTVRLIDLFAPIGKGARSLVMAPPQAGTSALLKSVIRSIEVNHPDVELLVLLIDERPEEITDISRWVLRGTVVSSAFDRPADEHVSVSELVIERAKRLVEQGKDVVVVADGITRLARAFNLVAPASGRVHDGDVEPAAIYGVKKFLGAARKAEEGGSLTVIATATVDSASRADEVIIESLRATANTEIRLDSYLAQRRRFPAFDVVRSGTRHEDSLVSDATLAKTGSLRRELSELGEQAGNLLPVYEVLSERLVSSSTNAKLLDSLEEN